MRKLFVLFVFFSCFAFLRAVELPAGSRGAAFGQGRSCSGVLSVRWGLESRPHWMRLAPLAPPSLPAVPILALLSPPHRHPLPAVTC